VAIPILFIPALARSAAALDLPAIINELRDWAVATLESLRTFSLFGYAMDLNSSVDPLIETLTSGGEGLEIDLGRVFGGAWAVTSAVFGGAVAFVTSTILALVLSIYIASAIGREKQSGWYNLVPAPYVPEVRILGARVSRVWTDYLRGQLTVAVVVGVLTTIVLFALGVPGALVLGVVGGVLNIIPTFGPIFAGVVAALVALIQGSDRFNVSNVVFALIVLGAYVILQQLESNLIAPRILGDAMAVSPLAILIGILVGFSGAGVLGAVVAVPVVASGREIFLYVRSKLVDEDPYPYGPPLPRRTLRDRWEEISPPKPSVADGSEEE
jgi:predicted PurR-regulated permease PerM